MLVSLASLFVVALSASTSMVAAADTPPDPKSYAPTPGAPTPTHEPTGGGALNLTKIAKTLPPGVPVCTGVCTQLVASAQTVTCGSVDVPCQCTNKDYIIAFTACINQQCTEAERPSVVTYRNSICKVFDRSKDPQIIPVVPSTLPNRTIKHSGTGDQSGDSNRNSGSVTSSGEPSRASSLSLKVGIVGVVVVAFVTLI